MPYAKAGRTLAGASRAGVRRLWKLPETELVTSAYAVEEARRNLGPAGRRSKFEELLAVVRVSNLLADPAGNPGTEGSVLPEKDLPILRAAVTTGCTHRVTGDRKHFGYLFAEEMAGVRDLRPADHRAGKGR